MSLMKQTYKISQLRGIVPPLATPLLSQHQLDEKGISRLVQHVVGGGVHGLFVLGTTGEALSLSTGMRKDLLQQVAEEVSGRVPLLVGITDTSLNEAVQFAVLAQQAHAAAVVAAPPFYFPTSQYALYHYFKTLAEEAPLPLFIYNIPSHTKVAFEEDTLLRLLDLPNIAGYKDSTGDMMMFHQLQLRLMDKPDKVYLVGPEELLAESVLFGGHGGINGGANIFPQLYVQLYEAAANREVTKMMQLHQKVITLSMAVYGKGGKGKSVIQGIKAALATMDICQDTVAAPLHVLTTEEKREIADFISQFDINKINNNLSDERK